jgi:hypothetical protein
VGLGRLDVCTSHGRAQGYPRRDSHAMAIYAAGF